jgi:hypothetical protein
MEEKIVIINDESKRITKEAALASSRKYRCGISQLTAAHFVGGHILGN